MDQDGGAQDRVITVFMRGEEVDDVGLLQPVVNSLGFGFLQHGGRKIHAVQPPRRRAHRRTHQPGAATDIQNVQLAGRRMGAKSVRNQGWREIAALLIPEARPDVIDFQQLGLGGPFRRSACAHARQQYRRAA